MRRFGLFLFVGVLFFFGRNASGQDLNDKGRRFTSPNSTNQSSTSLFQSDSIINLIIIADFKSLFRDRRSEPMYYGGKIFYFNKDSVPLYFEVRLRQRGNFRRQRENCSFPPLFINFKKSSVSSSLFAGQDKVKLVTHCRVRERFEQSVLNEYLAYKINNQLTSFSYKVRLAKITYIDSSGRQRPISRYGFFIESREEFEKRNGVSFVETKNLHQEVLDRYQMSLVTIFQYLIGNTDWSVPNRHNIDLYLGDPQDRLIPVAFDFDFSGVVNAPYAQPQPMLGINKVTDRLYRGFPRSEEEIDTILDLFRCRETLIMTREERLPSVSRGRQTVTKKFLHSFFEEISSQAMVKRIFINGSRKLD